VGLGCDLAEGYLFAHPITAEEMDHILTAKAPGATPVESEQ
jgi:EAL domain-containing protein (putative c-di-GMP-specific phosphodiesterase class I)